MSARIPSRWKRPESRHSVQCKTAAFILVIITLQPTRWTRSSRANCRKTPLLSPSPRTLLPTPSSHYRAEQQTALAGSSPSPAAAGSRDPAANREADALVFQIILNSGPAQMLCNSLAGVLTVIPSGVEESLIFTGE